MAQTLFLTISQPLTADQLEKLWDAEQGRRSPHATGRPQLRVRTQSPYSFELAVGEAHDGPISEEEAKNVLATVLRLDYPQCHITWGNPSEPESLPRKSAVSESPASSLRTQQQS